MTITLDVHQRERDWVNLFARTILGDTQPSGSKIELYTQDMGNNYTEGVVSTDYSHHI